MSAPAPMLSLTEVMASQRLQDAVAACVARGSILGIPTESSYGLAVDPRNAAGVAAVYEVKSREAVKPLPVVIADVKQLPQLGIDPEAPWLAALARFWPAPLSLVAATNRLLPAGAGTPSLAVRAPAHEALRALLGRLTSPLTATSANLAGESPMLVASEVAALLAGRDALVLDGGTLPGGAPSTLVAPGVSERGFCVLRRGAFDPDRLVRAGFVMEMGNS